MSRPKFTPGPWIVYHVGNVVEVDFGPVRDGGRGRAPVIHWNGFESSDLPIRTQAANARLIAAAPDLYEAVRLFLLEYQHITPKDERDPVWIGRAALAKASP